MYEISKPDWKLYQERLAKWQGAYMKNWTGNTLSC